jgi:hypothetical protein
MLLLVILFLLRDKKGNIISSLARYKRFLVLIVVGLSAVFAFSGVAAQQGRQGLEAARLQVEESGAYNFTADIEQTLIPRPVASMIGETSQRVDMRLDGNVTGPESAQLQLRFEGDGANAQPLIFEQEGQESYLLKEGERIKIDSPTGGALPTTDMMTYLAAAENVVVLEGDSAAPDGYTLYGFDINGTRMAQLVQGQYGAAGGRSELALSPTLRKTSGSGELWVDEDGFPRRQIIDLTIPEITDEYHTNVHMVVDYRYGEGSAVPELLPGYLSFGGAPETADDDQPINKPTAVWSAINPINYQLPIAQLLTFAAFSLMTAA